MLTAPNKPTYPTPTRRRPNVALLPVFALLIPLVGCPGPQLVHYDETTYQHLTFVKPEILALYDELKADPINDTKISGIDLKIAQIREYEAGKGPGNVDMTHQVDLIQNMFRKHIAERRRDGPWNDANLGNHKDAITKLLDIAIKTEQSLNR